MDGCHKRNVLPYFLWDDMIYSFCLEVNAMQAQLDAWQAKAAVEDIEGCHCCQEARALHHFSPRGLYLV
jgi:hypothetical protein